MKGADNQTQDTVNDETPAEKAERTGEPVFFEGTITKIDVNGDEVLSDHLMPGEKMARDLDEDLNYHEDDKDAVRKSSGGEDRRESRRDARTERAERERAEDKHDKPGKDKDPSGANKNPFSQTTG